MHVLISRSNLFLGPASFSVFLSRILLYLSDLVAGPHFVIALTIKEQSKNRCPCRNWGQVSLRVSFVRGTGLDRRKTS